ncbi:GtrA family protein, partial [Bacillus paranthracis]|uniref:GtrA family protein n=1 Tax=Bacillus paranthracis TaxID=2026186 RepID=UPI002852E702
MKQKIVHSISSVKSISLKHARKYHFVTNKWISFIKFALVGVVNTLIDFVVYALLKTIGVNYILAQWISYSVGILNSYVM